jgi:hypothetical protein
VKIPALNGAATPLTELAGLSGFDACRRMNRAGAVYVVQEAHGFPKRGAGRNQTRQGGIADFPNVTRAWQAVYARPAVIRGRNIPERPKAA